MKKEITTKIIKETEGTHRLGRHVEHDPLSRAFSAGTALVKTVTYKRHGVPFDQGELGSCTGNAMAGVLMTEPLWKPGRNLTETDAVKLYKAATKLDNIPGNYPPTDTGSSGLAVMKAAVNAKYIVGYAHSFSLDQLLGSLSLRPGILGINWYDSFDAAKPDGECPWPPTPRCVGATRSRCLASTRRRNGCGAINPGDQPGAAARTALSTSRTKRSSGC